LDGKEFRESLNQELEAWKTATIQQESRAKRMEEAKGESERAKQLADAARSKKQL
jgi:hypothetical protein